MKLLLLPPEITSIDLHVTRSMVGCAVFPVAASVINHSCDPNTATVVTMEEEGIGRRQVQVANFLGGGRNDRT